MLIVLSTERLRIIEPRAVVIVRSKSRKAPDSLVFRDSFALYASVTYALIARRQSRVWYGKFMEAIEVTFELCELEREKKREKIARDWRTLECEPGLNVPQSPLLACPYFLFLSLSLSLSLSPKNLARHSHLSRRCVWMHPLCRLCFRLVHRLSLGVRFSFSLSLFFFFFFLPVFRPWTRRTFTFGFARWRNRSRYFSRGKTAANFEQSKGNKMEEKEKLLRREVYLVSNRNERRCTFHLFCLSSRWTNHLRFGGC